MAGVDKEFTGEAWAAEGVTRRLPAAGAAARPRPRTCASNVMEGVAAQEGACSTATTSSPIELLRRDRRRDGASCRTRSTAKGLWDLDAKVEQAMDALRCPPDDADVDEALRRREAPRGAVPAAARRSPTCCCSTSRPTISTPRSVAWLEALPARTIPGTVVVVTHDRYFLDNVTGWILELDRGRGIPYEGNYSSWLEQKQKRLEQEEKRGRGAPAHARARARMDRGIAARRARPRAKARYQRYEELLAKIAASSRRRRGADRHPAWPSGWAERRDRGRAPDARASATSC